jgi:hypothetical protein
MDKNIPIYIGTVALEKNRWGSRIPSFNVSEWIERFKSDGFDGIELWEYHYLLADDSEKEKLNNLTIPVLYNSYVGFTDEDQEDRDKAVEAINKIKPHAIKFNVKNDPDKFDEYKKNLLSWSDAIYPECSILCECHGGTLLEDLETAKRFFSGMDPERFGIIQHPMGDLKVLNAWYEVFDKRIEQLHMQFRTPESNPETPQCRESLEKLAEFLNEKGFSGKLTIEFTRGIGKEENIEDIYQNACSDMKVCREIFK